MAFRSNVSMLHYNLLKSWVLVVQEKLPGGGATDRVVNVHGLMLPGFLFLHALFIERGRLETTWTVLQKFGYNNDIELAEELIPSFKRDPDQSTELASDAVEFLQGIYELFDCDYNNNLSPAELEDIFSTAPESPWDEPPYKDAVEKTALGGPSLNAFLLEWALMTLLDPSRAVENLIYIAYPGPAFAVCVTRKRRVDRK